MADPGEVPAVKRPPDVIVPSPVTDQFAGTFELNCRVLPSISVTVAGETVIHAKWGEGVVLDVKGEGDRAEATVRFPSVGEKRLALSLAPIKRV